MAILRKNGYAEIRIFLSLPLLPLKKAGKEFKETLPGTGKMEDLIQATSLSVNEFNKMDSLSEYSLVVLANLQNLDSSKAKELEIFTENGGGVFVCSGNQMDIDWYNDSWGPKGVISYQCPLRELRVTSKMNSLFLRFPVLILSIPHSPCLMIRGTEAWRKLR